MQVRIPVRSSAAGAMGAVATSSIWAAGTESAGDSHWMGVRETGISRTVLDAVEGQQRHRR